MAARKKITKKASKPATKKAQSAGTIRKAKAKAAARGSHSAPAKKKLSAATKAEAALKAEKAAKARRVAASKKAAASAKSAGKAKASSSKRVAKAAEAKRTVKAAAPKHATAKSAKAAPAASRAAPAVKAVESALKVRAVEPPAVKSVAPVAPVSVAPAATATKASETTVTTNAPATAPRPIPAAKAFKAPTAEKAFLKDEQGGEPKIMKSSGNRHGFKLNEFVVYPAHGVGQIVSVEEQEVAGFRLELFVISFTKDKMTLRVPTSKVTGVGMRKLSDPDAARRSLDILTGRARIKRTMWSRRAQEYEAKINSGDINAIAEVVRDLFRSEAQPEQSYSERQLYEAALDRMMREIAAVQKLSDIEALKVIEIQLRKNQKRAGKAEAGSGEEPEIEEAA